MNDGARLTAQQFQEAGDLEDWRVLAVGASAWFDAPSHAAGAALVHRVAALANAASHQPDIDLRATGVHVRTLTLAVSGLTERDASLARAISAAARDLGLSADPSAVQAVQLTVDALDKPSVMPFWRAALGYEPIGDDDLVDAMRRDPAIWFQQMAIARPLRNRVHLDVGVPHDLAHERVAAVKAAGGREAFGIDYYVTLADAEGNEVDVAPLVPESALEDVPETADWRVLFGAMTYYPTASYGQAARFAAAVAELSDDAGMALLVDMRAGGVTIDTGKDQWVDERFGDLARQVQAVARAMRLTADPSRVRFVQIGIDAVDIPAARSFWRAVLGYEFDERPDVTDIYDPRRLNPPLFSSACPPTTKRDASSATASMSISSCPTTRLPPASRRRSLPAGGSCTTPRRRSGGHSPTPRATRWTSPSRWAARRSGWPPRRRVPEPTATVPISRRGIATRATGDEADEADEAEELVGLARRRPRP